MIKIIESNFRKKIIKFPQSGKLTFNIIINGYIDREILTIVDFLDSYMDPEMHLSLLKKGEKYAIVLGVFNKKWEYLSTEYFIDIDKTYFIEVYYGKYTKISVSDKELYSTNKLNSFVIKKAKYINFGDQVLSGKISILKFGLRDVDDKRKNSYIFYVSEPKDMDS